MIVFITDHCFSIYFKVPDSDLLQTKFQDNWPSGSEEEDF